MARHGKDTDGADWVSLEYLFRAFPSTRRQRRAWLQACGAVDAVLSAQGHHGLPALIPGLVHARVATALLTAGYCSKRDLRGRRLLCLGCHAGLEVRIVRDFGALQVLGVEIRPGVVRASWTAGLVTRDEVLVQDFWDYLRAASGERYDTVMVLNPHELPLRPLWALAKSRLLPGGQMVVVAQEIDVLSVPPCTVTGPAMEETMRWYRLERDH